MREINSISCSRQPPQGYQAKENKGEQASNQNEGVRDMTAVRTAKQVKRVLAEAGQVEAAPAAQMRNRRIEVVTDTERQVDPETGDQVTVTTRMGLKVVSKIDWLYARQHISQAQYAAALEVLHWFQKAQLAAPSALQLLTQSGGAGGQDGWTVARLDALTRLRRLSAEIGKPMMGLLIYVLLDEGDLADWTGLAISTRARRTDYRTGATMALLLIALDRIAEGA